MSVWKCEQRRLGLLWYSVVVRGIQWLGGTTVCCLRLAGSLLILVRCLVGEAVLLVDPSLCDHGTSVGHVGRRVLCSHI